MSTPTPTPGPAATVPGKTPAYLVVWACRCSDVQTDPTTLPDRCPGHDRGRIANPERLDCLNQYVGIHECPNPGPSACWASPPGPTKEA